MLTVEICRIQNPLFAMPGIAAKAEEKFKDWAKSQNLKYKFGKTNRFIQMDDANFMIFALSYPYEYSVVREEHPQFAKSLSKGTKF